MAKIIKNMNDLAKALQQQITSILELVAQDVKAEIDETIREYYDEYYPPISYHRVDELRKSCKISEPKINGTNVSIEVYLDYKNMHYKTKGADPYKTVRAADAGLHGGWNPANISAGQVPWNQISSNDGSRHGSGTQIWEEPMHELIDNGKLIELFKKHAKARGLNIK